MDGETCFSEALVSFLVEVAQEQNVPKNIQKKKRCYADFLSFFAVFDLQEFLVDLEKVSEEHIRLCEDPSISNFVRMRELAFVSELKLGCMRVLEWLFTIESEACQKFIDEGERTLDRVLASVRRLGIDDSSSFKQSSEPAPRRTRKPRKIPEPTPVQTPELAAVDAPEHTGMKDGVPAVEAQDHPEGSPELYREELENEASLSETLLRTDMEDNPFVHPDDPEPSVLPDMGVENDSVVQLDDPEPSVLPDMEVEEQMTLPVENHDSELRFEPLREIQSSAIPRRPGRPGVIDKRTRLSDYVLKQRLLSSSKLSVTVEENRDDILSLVSRKVVCARDLLVYPSVHRGTAITQIFMKRFKELRPRKAQRANRIVHGENFQVADGEDGNLPGYVEPADDREGTPTAQFIQSDEIMEPPNEEAPNGEPPEDLVPEMTARSLPAESDDVTALSGGDVSGTDSGPGIAPHLLSVGNLEEVYSLISGAANRFHQQGNIRLRYACLSDVARSISENEIPVLFKSLLILSASGQLYIKQSSPENGQIFIFPRNQAKEQTSRA